MARFITLYIISTLLLTACAPAAQTQTSGTEPLGETSQPQTTVSNAEPTAIPPTGAPAPIVIGEAVCTGQLTLAQPEGPFYTPSTPQRTNLVEAGMGGTPLLVTGKVLDQDCQPIAGVMLDFWQTDENGEYDNQGYRLRGHQFTDVGGNYTLETIIPARYPSRTPHIHVKIFAPDGRLLLITQLYIRGISDQIPDGIFSPELLTRDLEPDSDGRRHVAFDFIIDYE